MGNANMNLVPVEDVYSENVLYTNVVCESGDYPMGLDGPNETMRGRVVDKNVDGGMRGCPTDFVSLNKGLIGPLVHVQLVGQVYSQWVCSQWAHVLQGTCVESHVTIGGVMVCLGSVGCGSVTGLPGGKGVRGTMSVRVHTLGVVPSPDGATMALGSARSDWAGMVGWKSLKLGMGPINVSVSVPQLNWHGSCGVTWLSSVPSHSIVSAIGGIGKLAVAQVSHW